MSSPASVTIPVSRPEAVRDLLLALTSRIEGVADEVRGFVVVTEGELVRLIATDGAMVGGISIPWPKAPQLSFIASFAETVLKDDGLLVTPSTQVQSRVGPDNYRKVLYTPEGVLSRQQIPKKELLELARGAGQVRCRFCRNWIEFEAVDPQTVSRRLQEMTHSALLRHEAVSENRWAIDSDRLFDMLMFVEGKVNVILGLKDSVLLEGKIADKLSLELRILGRSTPITEEELKGAPKRGRPVGSVKKPTGPPFAVEYFKRLAEVMGAWGDVTQQLATEVQLEYSQPRTDGGLFSPESWAVRAGGKRAPKWLRGLEVTSLQKSLKANKGFVTETWACDTKETLRVVNGYTAPLGDTLVQGAKEAGWVVVSDTGLTETTRPGKFTSRSTRVRHRAITLARPWLGLCGPCDKKVKDDLGAAKARSAAFNPKVKVETDKVCDRCGAQVKGLTLYSAKKL